MDLTKKTVHYTQEGKTVFDRFYLDEDYNVPEQKEAVQRIVYSSAKLKTEDVRPVENYVKVTGKAYYKILYMTQGETTLSVLEGKIPFEERSMRKMTAKRRFLSEMKGRNLLYRSFIQEN